jgi:hypothetical protein
MTKFPELMRAAGLGSAFDGLAREHGLSAQVAEATVAALMPAFALGLQHALRAPGGAKEVLALVAGKPFADAYDNATAALPPEVRATSNEVLATVIGSERVQKAVAAQAAAQAGVAEAVAAELMPAIAAALADGLIREQGRALDAWAKLWSTALPSESATATSPPPEEPHSAIEAMFALGHSVQTAQIEAYRRLFEAAWGTKREP